MLDQIVQKLKMSANWRPRRPFRQTDGLHPSPQVERHFFLSSVVPPVFLACVPPKTAVEYGLGMLAMVVAGICPSRVSHSLWEPMP